MRNRDRMGPARAGLSAGNLSARLLSAHRSVLAAVAAGILCAATAAPVPALAQAIPQADLDAITRQQQQIQRMEEDRLRQQEQDLRSRSRTLPPPGLTPAPPAAAAEEDAVCIPVSRVDLDGMDRLSRWQVDDLLDQPAGTCMDVAAIEALVRALTNRYVGAGYSTARLYIPQQDLSSGVLRLIVQEGRVESLRIDDGGQGPEIHARTATAFPGVEGGVLNLREIEQGLDQMNRLRANAARIDIAPGSTAGTSALTITNQRRLPLFLDIGTDNSGSPSTGERQGFTRIEADDLLRINDLWTVDYRRSLVDQRTTRKSDSLSGSVSVPYGFWTASLSGSWFGYRSPVTGLNQTFLTSGQSRSWRGRIDRVIHRDDVSKTTVSAGFGGKTTRNYVEGTVLDSGSRKLSSLTVEGSHTRRLADGTVSLTLGHEAGLGALGAKADAGRREDAPEAQFEKWTADAVFSHPLPGFDADWPLQWTTSARVQWSPDTLFSTERVSVGGLYSVRGFKDQSISGDVGGYVRNDLRLTLPKTGEGWLDQGLGRVALSVGYDIGAIRHDWRDSLEQGRLSGVSAGVSTSGGMVPVSFIWARPLTAPAVIGTREDVFYLSVGFSL